MTTSLLLVLLLQLIGSALTAPLEEIQEYARIVNGHDAQKDELSYQVSLQYEVSMRSFLGVGPASKSYSHYCGGTLVRSDWVLTAAHCTLGRQPQTLQVVLGALQLNDTDNPTFAVDRIVKHVYNRKDKMGDISLLHLVPKEGANSRLMTHHAEPIELAGPDFNPVGQKCIVSGWGRLQYNGMVVPTNLQETEVQVLTPETCATVFLPKYPWDKNFNTMLCAGGMDKDACQGDSGGPFVCKKPDGKRIMVGVTSWGVQCATEGIPGVYANVATFKDWIDRAVADPDNVEQMRE